MLKEIMPLEQEQGYSGDRRIVAPVSLCFIFLSIKKFVFDEVCYDKQEH